MAASSSLILSHVRPWGAAPVDVTIREGVIAAVVPHNEHLGTAVRPTTPAQQEEALPVVDGRGLLALPGFVNAHAHIDKSWWEHGWVSYGGEGTTQGRIAHERAHREEYGIPSTSGVEAVAREFLRHGTTATRSHVDVDLGVGLRGVEAVLEAERNLGGALEVEIVAFPQDGVIRRPGVLALLEEAVALGVRNIGGIDPASIDRDPVAQLDGLFDIVDRTGVGLDLHLHDPAELGAFQIELIAERTIAVGAQGRVNVAHGFALGDLQGAAQERLLGLLVDAGISWTTVAPPRTSRLPWRFMRENGLGLGLGTDGIRDLWSPYGDGDVLRVANSFARLHGLVRDEDLLAAVRLASSDAAAFVHRDTHDLVVGARADIVLLDAINPMDALMRSPRRELVLSAGREVAREGQLLI